MNHVTRQFFVSGMVQGVGYRFFVQRVAARHQVTGYVRNLPDGRVEVWAEGPSAQVAAVRDELAVGPAYATVTNIEEINIETPVRYPAFRIER